MINNNDKYIDTDFNISNRLLVILVIFVRAFLDNGCGSKLIEIEDFLDISSCSILKKMALLRELCSTILSLSSKIRGICYFESK